MKKSPLLLLGAGLLLACSKQDDLLLVGLPDNAGAVYLYKEFSRRNSPPEQAFALTLAQPQTVVTSGGARIEVPANAFLLPDGTGATGQAQLRVRELYTAPDMLLADMPTGDLSGTKLVSGGEFKLQVWQNGTRLRLRPNESVVLASPLPNRSGLGIDSAMTAWRLQLPAFTWANTGISAVTALSAGQAFYRTRLPLDSLSWWNVDRLWSPSPSATRTDAKFTFDTDGASSTFTRSWVLPTGANAVFPTYLSSTTPGAPTNLLLLPAVPVGSRLTAVVLQVRFDGLYYGSIEADAQAGQVPHIALSKLPEAEILRRIRLL